MLAYDAIGRVLAAVASEGVDIPPHLADATGGELGAREEVRRARQGLAMELSMAFTLQAIQPDLVSMAKARKRQTELHKISSLASKLSSLLDEGGPHVRMIALHLVRGGLTPVSEISLALGHLRRAADVERDRRAKRKLAEGASMSKAETPDLGTPRLAFISSMERIFQNEFGLEPRIFHDKANQPTGPFVAFVVSVTREAGKVMTPQAVRGATRKRSRKSPDKDD